MALPKLEAPKHNCVLPSNNQTVYYRPFLVGEQKILLMAQEEDNSETQIREMIRLINVCVDDIVAEDLSAVDLEFLFLQLRIKSVGETSDIGLECEFCQEPNELTVNLDSATVVRPEVVEDIIQLTPAIAIKMSQPSYTNVAKATEGSKSEANSVFEIIKTCIDSIIDGDEIHTKDDFTSKELNDFLDTMDLKMLDKIQEYLSSVPSLEINTSYTCEKCSEVNDTVLKGVGNFFG